MRNGARKVFIEVLQQVATAHPDTNEPMPGVPTVWAQSFGEVQARAGREFFEAGQRDYESQVHIWFPYFDVVGIESTMRLRFEGAEYAIKDIQIDFAKREFIKVVAVAGTDAQ